MENRHFLKRSAFYISHVSQCYAVQYATQTYWWMTGM